MEVDVLYTSCSTYTNAGCDALVAQLRKAAFARRCRIHIDDWSENMTLLFVLGDGAKTPAKVLNYRDLEKASSEGLEAVLAAWVREANSILL